jgi:hypothetical protein
MRVLSVALALTVGACSAAHPNPGFVPPAPPTYGEQIPFGPFDVAPGGEVQLCRTLKLSNDEPMAVNRLEVIMNEGSHHLIVFRSYKDFPDEIFPCWGTVNFDDWDFVMDVNRSGGYDWKLAPGQAFVMKPHQQIMIQSHYVNATTVQSPDGARNYVNLHATHDPVAHELRGMFTVNSRLNIPPQSYWSTTRRCRFSRDAQIVAMTGHFHARGLEFTVNKFQDPETGDITTPEFDMGRIYTSDSWNAPNFQVFDPPQLVSIPQGLRFDCSYYNDSDNWIGFGGHADVQEHCNLFFQYYDTLPGQQPLRCAEGSGGW